MTEPFKPSIDDGLEPQPRPLDAAIAAFSKTWAESDVPDLYVGSGPEMRERARCVRGFLYPKPKLPKGQIDNFDVAGPDGAIPCRTIWPVAPQANGKAAIGTMVYYHGGGWTVGDLDSHEMHAVRLANTCGLVVVMVDYRLAPEHIFPAAVDDAWAALQWVKAHLADLGGADAPLTVGGDSAGGNLAAVMAILARDAGIELAAQLLLYPATDLAAEGDTPVRRLYLGADAERVAADPRVSPRHAASFAGLAPTILAVGVHDFLYRDNLAYARALRAAGSSLEALIFDDLNHGFFSYTAVSERSLAAAQQVCERLSECLAQAAH